MARPTNVPLTQEGADKVAAYLHDNPGANVITTCRHFRTTRHRLRELCKLFGVEVPCQKRKVKTAARGVIGEIFAELERRRINQSRIARELQRSPYYVLCVRAGTAEPRMFDVECLATLAGMKLTIERVGTV